MQSQEVMKIALLCLVSVLLLFPQLVTAGEVYGRVWVASGNKIQVVRGAKITVACPGGLPRTVMADGRGNYRAANADSGRCTVQVAYKRRTTNRILISLKSGGSSANLGLRKRGKGWSLSRR